MNRPIIRVGILLVYSIVFLYAAALFQHSSKTSAWAVKFRDIFFNIRYASSDKPAALDQMVLVTVDEESCQKLSQRWPWSRKTLAQLVRELKRQGGEVIALNFSFTGAEGQEDEASQELAKAMMEHGRVVVGSTFSGTRHLLKPHQVIGQAADGHGYLEKIVDADLVLRRSFMIRLYDRNLLGVVGAGFKELYESSFPLMVLRHYLSRHHGQDPGFDPASGLLTIGDNPPKAVYLQSDGSYDLNYLAKEKDFPSISAWKVLQARNNPQDIKGKAVFVGLTSAVFAEKHVTPLGFMSGVAIHANEFLAVLENRSLVFVPSKITFFLSWALSMGVLVLVLWRKFWWAAIYEFVALFAALVIAELFFSRDLVLEPAHFLLGPLVGGLLGLALSALSLSLDKQGLESRVVRDKLTGLYNYEYLRFRLEDEWKRCRKLKTPVSVAMMDLDHFKRINDTLGHEVGNQVIIRAAEVIRQSARGSDVVARYGGDEFTVMLWHSNRDQAEAYRIRLRELYHAMVKKLDDPLLQASSISIGIATYDPIMQPGNMFDPQRFIEEADQDLFNDKKSRRAPGG